MENSTIWGLDKITYNQLATKHSRVNIFLWIIGGLVFNLLNKDLISLSSVLVIFPGMFIISFASIPTLWVNIKKIKIIQDTKNFFVLLGFTIWALIDLIYPVLLSIVFIKIINLIF